MSAPFDDNAHPATVLSHHDGDTSRVRVRLEFDLSVDLTVRWFGVDAPELATPEGKAALAWVQAALPPGTEVTVRSAKSGKEKFGRYLATFFSADGTNINEELVRAGHAVPYAGGPR